MFLVLFTFMRRDDSGHGVMMRPVTLQADSAVPDAAWVPSVLAAQGEATAQHTRRAAFTGSHSSYSPRSSPDSSDLGKTGQPCLRGQGRGRGPKHTDKWASSMFPFLS